MVRVMSRGQLWEGNWPERTLRPTEMPGAPPGSGEQCPRRAGTVQAHARHSPALGCRRPRKPRSTSHRKPMRWRADE